MLLSVTAIRDPKRGVRPGRSGRSGKIIARVRTLAVALTIVTLAVFAPRSAYAAQWVRLRSPHFVVVGDAPERTLRQVAQRVEGFRKGLIQALPNATVAIPVPMTIVAFATDAGFTPYKPLVKGKPMERLAGYFFAGEDANFIGMTVAYGDAAYPTILHEYTHALLAETFPDLPLWLHEGIAEVYASYTERADGRSALIGAAPPHHLRELQTGTPMAIEDLLAADQRSSFYNEGDRRGMFYAKAWALSHYLLLGNPTRRAQVPEYLRLIATGASVDAALRAAFACEPKTLENELRDYGRQFMLAGLSLPLDPADRGQLALTAEPISDAEATAYTVELLTRQGRTAEAEQALDRVLKQAPGLPRALAARGRLYVRAGRVDDGLPLLRAAADALPNDASVRATYARALVDQLRPQGLAAAGDRAAVSRATEALAVAAALDPDDAYVVAMQGYMALLTGDDFDMARQLLERAVRQAPARHEYHLLLAQVYLAQRDLKAAQGLLGPLIARGAQPRIRDQARQLLARAADDAGATSALTAAASSVLILRTPEEGERRVLGTFERIECSSDTLQLHVRTASGPLQLRAAPLEAVDFINYRDEPVPPMGCRSDGLPVRVVATFRERPAGADAVAIEFVPDDYELR